MKFSILMAVMRACSKLTSLGFRTVEVGRHREILACDKALKRPWLISKDHLLPAQKQHIMIQRKFGKNTGRPARVNKELLA